MDTKKACERIFGRENRTYLMGGAMLWIVIFHICIWSEMSGISTGRFAKIFGDGAAGVDVFLLLSAYGLQASIEKNKISQYYRNRIKRLFPVYFVFLITFFVTCERTCPINRMIVQSLFQISGLSLLKYPDFFSCGFCFDWFTPAIISVYLFFPVISRTIKLIIDRGLLFEVLSLLIIIFVSVWIRENKHFPFGLLALRFPIIFLGCAIFIHMKKQEVQKILIICLISACVGLISGNVEMKRSLLVLPFLLVFSITQFQLPFKKSVCLVGKHSYEVYLAHILIVAFFIPTKVVSYFYIICIITMVSTIIIAFLFSYLQNSFYFVLNYIKNK